MDYKTKVLAVTGSALGEKSIGRATFEKVVEYTKSKDFNFAFDETTYKAKDFNEKVQVADLIIFTTSPFHCGIQSGLAEFLISTGDALKCKYVAGFISSSGLFEMICEQQLKAVLTSLGADYISGYSAIEYSFIDNHGKKSDVNVRTGNNLDDMSTWLISMIESVENSSLQVADERAIIITTLSESDEYRQSVENEIRKRYSVDIINLNDYKVVDCTGCKACYTYKKCCLKDDYKELETKVSDVRKVYYIIDMICGIPNPVFLRFMQRAVHNGLYPNEKDVGTEHLYFIKSCGYDTSVVKEQLVANDSFGRIFSEVFVDDEFKRFCRQDFIIGRQQGEKSMPNMNCYTRFFTWHFDNLSVMLKNLLISEYEFFRNHRYCKVPDVNGKAVPIHNIDEAKITQMGRLEPVKTFNVKETASNKETETKKGFFRWKK